MTHLTLVLGGARSGKSTYAQAWAQDLAGDQVLFVATAGALIGVTLASSLRPYLFAAHRLQGKGHRSMLAWLGLGPVLDLDLRLGEDTGAALAMGVCDAACKVLDEMATFAEAGVAGEED